MKLNLAKIHTAISSGTVKYHNEKEICWTLTCEDDPNELCEDETEEVTVELLEDDAYVIRRYDGDFMWREQQYNKNNNQHGLQMHRFDDDNFFNDYFVDGACIHSKTWVDGALFSEYYYEYDVDGNVVASKSWIDGKLFSERRYDNKQLV